MENAILQKLKDGEKFDFETLLRHPEATENYWDWWWENVADMDQIGRPEIISDTDSILTATSAKTEVSLTYGRDSFEKFLYETTEKKQLPQSDNLDRNVFRQRLIQIVGANSTKLESKPHLVFAGGGYGSGKTTILSELASHRVLPLGVEHMAGVDYFKLYIPEFNLIKSVGDGRASFTVQNECQSLARQLFMRSVAESKSFIWDSSMSNRVETLARIEQAKTAGYELTLIAVLTSVDVAVRQAMSRAKLRRRFPYAGAFADSHKLFKQSLHEYVEHFDEVKIFANYPDRYDVPAMVARKSSGQKELEILDNELLTHATLV